MLPEFTTVSSTLQSGTDGLFIKREQDIPSDLLAHLRAEKDASASCPAGEFHRVASIPVILVETWQRQGFDVFKEPAKAILARLRAEGVDAFITTTKI